MQKPDTGFPLERASWQETLASLTPFAIFGLLLSVPNLLRLQINTVWGSVVFFLAALFVPLILGIVHTLRSGRVQAWFLPQAGLTLGLLVFFLVNPVRFPGFLRHTAWGFRILYTQGVDWWALIVLALAAALYLRNTRFRARPQDGTLPSFLVYGAIQWGLYLSYGDYPVRQVFYLNYFFYLLLSSLALAAGALLYMRSRRHSRKFLWLLAGALAAITVAAAGKTYMIVGGGFLPHRVDWVNELNNTLALAGWMLLALVAPLAVRNPFKPKMETTGEIF